MAIAGMHVETSDTLPLSRVGFALQHEIARAYLLRPAADKGRLPAIGVAKSRKITKIGCICRDLPCLGLTLPMSLPTACDDR
jgi:hypothetical protein